MKKDQNTQDVLIHSKEIFDMKKHTFSKKLLSVTLSALTAFSDIPHLPYMLPAVCLLRIPRS